MNKQLKKVLYEQGRSDQDQKFQEQAEFLLKKQKLDRIDNFNDYFDFLNNDYPCPVYYEGIIYGTVTHAFQAARTQDQDLREKIANSLENPTIFFELCLEIDDPEDWQKVRLKIMQKLIRDKFRRNRDLRERLKQTGNRDLINTYEQEPTQSNLFWGVVDGKGQNQLGRILIEVRNDIKADKELVQWINLTFSIQEDKLLVPKINIDVVKEGMVIESLSFQKNIIFFGTLKTNDVLMAHQSISRQHSVIIIDQTLGVILVDLGSKAGTQVNKKKIEAHIPILLKENDNINFGLSSRTYVAKLDYSLVEKTIEKRKQQLVKDLQILEQLDNPQVEKEILMASMGLVPEDTIIVYNISENADRRQMENLFKEFGSIKEIKIPFDKKTGKNKRICSIQFRDEESAKKAVLKIDKMEIDGKKLAVRLAEKKSVDQIIEEKAQELKQKQNNRDNSRKIYDDFERRHRVRSRSPKQQNQDRHKYENRDHDHQKNSRDEKYKRENKHYKEKKYSRDDKYRDDKHSSKNNKSDPSREDKHRENHKKKDKKYKNIEEDRSKDYKHDREKDSKKVKERDEKQSRHRDHKKDKYKESNKRKKSLTSRSRSRSKDNKKDKKNDKKVKNNEKSSNYDKNKLLQEKLKQLQSENNKNKQKDSDDDDNSSNSSNSSSSVSLNQSKNDQQTIIKKEANISNIKTQKQSFQSHQSKSSSVSSKSSSSSRQSQQDKSSQEWSDNNNQKNKQQNNETSDDSFPSDLDM